MSFYQGWIGQASCGCLGAKVSVNPWIMFTIDVAAFFALLLARPDLTPLWVHRVRILSVCSGVLGAYLLLLGSVAGIAHVRYGSIDAALASLRNERLSLQPALVDMGEGIAGEERDASVELTNWTEHPIRLIGGTADCSCTVLGDLPITIPPGESRSITVTMRLPKTPGLFNRKAQLTIDDEGFKRIGFRLIGRISRAAE
ncbi:MAG: DUF1573 domain-containing protein [Planctomycetes bacterium]|nr:DUF1573 domain-containing protein [Planctomycetota bacterium]